MKPEIKRAPRSAAKKVQAKPPLTILDACDDPGIFGPWFEDKQTWAAWFVVLKAMFGLPLDDADLALFQKHTGRTTPAPGGYFDLSLVVGRRGGKSLILALIAAFLSCFFDWRPFLTGGERAVIMIIAADKRQRALSAASGCLPRPVGRDADRRGLHLPQPLRCPVFQGYPGR
jgi:hypothetical protein